MPCAAKESVADLEIPTPVENDAPSSDCGGANAVRRYLLDLRGVYRPTLTGQLNDSAAGALRCKTTGMRNGGDAPLDRNIALDQNHIRILSISFSLAFSGRPSHPESGPWYEFIKSSSLSGTNCIAFVASNQLLRAHDTALKMIAKCINGED